MKTLENIIIAALLLVFVSYIYLELSIGSQGLKWVDMITFQKAAFLIFLVSALTGWFLSIYHVFSKNESFSWVLFVLIVPFLGGTLYCIRKILLVRLIGL